MDVLVDLQACQSESRYRGIGRYSLALTDGLLRIGAPHQFQLLLNAQFPHSAVSLRDRFADRLPREQMHVFDGLRHVAEIDAANQWRCRAAERIREACLARIDPDVVLLSSLFEGFVDDATTSISTNTNTNTLTAVTLYDLIPLVRPATLATDEARAWYARKIESLRRADLLLAISQHAQDEACAALDMPREQVVVIGTAADPAFHPIAPEDPSLPELHARWDIARPYVLYAGGFDERKNVRNLVAAFAAMPPEVRERHELVLAGRIDERERRAIRQFAEQHRLPRERLRFPGRVDDAELAALYSQCEVFAFPSLHEGFGLPVLEAMSCGAAVIGSNTTSIPEVIGRSDVLFDPNDVRSITAALESVLRDGSFRADLRRHALARSKQFSWDDVARRALEALTEGRRRKAERPRKVALPANGEGRVRPTLAYVSPLPPERTGIASYSADLLVPLSEHYRIDVVADQKTVELPPELATLPVRTLEWFDANADQYDRIVYQIGNSPFHHRMFELLERHAGTVVLHDFHLGAVLNWMEQSAITPGIFSRWLFESHGYAALIADREQGRDAAIDKYPCSFPLISRANGLVVHSMHALELAASSFRLQANDWRRIAQLRRLPDLSRREAAREALGFADDDIVFCCFGFIHPTKLDDRIVDAWLASPLAHDVRCTLVFVGENHGGDYGRELALRAERSSSRIRITGFVDTATFDNWLLAADVAVQLRGATRGEASRTVLDALAHGLPVVCNASPSMRDVPSGSVLQIPSDFSDQELADALVQLAHDPALRERFATSARRTIEQHHDPSTIAAELRDAIEAFAVNGPLSAYRRLINALVESTTKRQEPNSSAARPVERLSADDWDRVAQGAATTLLRPATRQILVDVSVLVTQDLRTGIERVVRAVLRELLEREAPGYRVEPVMARNGAYWYARQFTCEWLGVAHTASEDAPIDAADGDVFIGLDWAAHIVPDYEPALDRYRALGVTIVFVVYDILPVLRPDFYPAGIQAMHSAWLHTLARVADGILCISGAVADELTLWLAQHTRPREPRLNIAVLPLGADIERSVPTEGLPLDAEAMLERIAARPVVLMVGTVEPRKGHAQALAAFESLWRDGHDVHLVIVGKQGWMVDELATQLRVHAEQDKRLFWFERASDEFLDALYRSAGLLLAASLGEGYGLPLIEAARYGVPLLLRDIPVFREVAGANAMYFSGLDGKDIARAVRDWQKASEDNKVPDSTRIERRSWRDAVDSMLSTVLENRWQRAAIAEDVRSPATDDETIRQIEFTHAWLPSAVQSVKGLSAREPWGRWSDADVHPHIEIRFRDSLPASGSVEVVGRAFGPNVHKPALLRIGDQEFELLFEAGDTTHSFQYAVRERPRTITIAAAEPVAPRELGLSLDSRRLGIGLTRLTVRARATHEEPDAWTGSRIARLIDAEVAQRAARKQRRAHRTSSPRRPDGTQALSITQSSGSENSDWVDALDRLPEFRDRLQAVENRLDELRVEANARSEEASAEMREAFGSVSSEIRKSLDSIRGTTRERLQEYALLSERHESLLRGLERLEKNIGDIAAHAQALQSALDRLLPPPLSEALEVPGTPIAEAAHARSGFCVTPSQLTSGQRYAIFENAFYDSSIVAAKQRIYVRYLDRALARQHPFLDLGCGRGEFMKILRDEGISSVGVDSNPTPLHTLRCHGFAVEVADILAFLEADAGIYCGASALQVVEHMSADDVQRMLALVARRLPPAAPLFVETPNPLSPFALARFHTDPTHVAPLPPERLRFEIEAAGFERSLTLFQARAPGDPYAGPDPQAYYMDYAIIAYRSAA